MIDTLLKKAKGFLTDPAAAFRKAGNDGAEPVLAYFTSLLVLHAFISAVLPPAIAGSGLAYAMMAGWSANPGILFLSTVVTGFIGALVFGAWLHLWAFILGGRQGIWQTVKTVMYGGTPWLLFGWIPLIGFLAALWALYLIITGVNELQGISAARAILAVAIAVMLPLILLILAASFFFIAYSTTTAVPVEINGLQ